MEVGVAREAEAGELRTRLGEAGTRGCGAGLGLREAGVEAEAGLVMVMMMKVTERDQRSSVTHPSLRVPFALQPDATENNTGLAHRSASFISEHCFRNVKRSPG